MFQVGDVITGKAYPYNHYGITNEDATMRVVSAGSNTLGMTVEVIGHRYERAYIGSRHRVDNTTLKFRLCEPPVDREDLSIWADTRGKGYKFSEMEYPHLLNVAALLYRKAGKKNPQRNKLVTIEKELLRRLKDV